MRAEHLEPRYVLSGVEFVEHAPIVESELDLPEAIHAADLDGDGDTDVISASRGDDKIAWYENLDAAGTFGRQRIITTDADAAMSVSTADLDGDSDLDVLSVSRDDNKIAWYENIDGVGTFGSQRIVTNDVHGLSSLHVADLDTDGDLDVLYPSAGPRRQVVWFENTDGRGSFGPARVIRITGRNAWAVSSADLDGDKDLDIVVSWALGNRDDTVVWLENTNGLGDFGPPQLIGYFGAGRSLFAQDADGDGDIDVLTGRGWAENKDGKGDFQPRELYNTYYTRSTAVADLDSDGHVDVVSFPNLRNTIIWSRNTDGFGNFETRTLIESGLHISSLDTADVNGDGHQDLIAANVISDELFWYENSEGNGTFDSRNVFTISHVEPLDLRAMDLDTDGDLDVLATSSSVSEVKIAWYENIDGRGTFGTQQLIIADVGNGSRIGADADLCTVDVDADRDIDIVVASTFWDHGATSSHVSWYENTGGALLFGPRQVISTGIGGSLDCVDLDGDGDVDLLSAFNYWDADDYYSEILWHENTDGAGAFGQPIPITSQTGSESSVSPADLDGDGDLDVLATSKQRGTDSSTGTHVAWYENTLGPAGFSGPRMIATSSNGAMSAHSVDLDSDGDLDILTVSNHNHVDGRRGDISWYENADGAGNFGPERWIISAPTNTLSARAVDLDGEGDLDLVALSYGRRNARVVWHQNVDGAGNFGAEEPVAMGAAYSLETMDMDDDGDRDILFVTPKWNGYEMVWHENTDGDGTFGPRQTIADGLVPVVADLDGDQDLDILAATEDQKIVWYENVTHDDLTAQAGDANRDGEFDNLDIVQVLRANKFSSGEPATWGEGDYNTDGLFDQMDIVVALQTGNYLQGPYTGRPIGNDPRVDLGNVNPDSIAVDKLMAES